MRQQSKKITEKIILKKLIELNSPILSNELSKQLSCNENDLISYLNALSSKGLVVVSRYEYKENEKYSPKRGKNVYAASPLATEYLVEQKRVFVAFVCTVIAAVMATLTLAVTVLIPFIS